MSAANFREVEHKFLVGEDFDLPGFITRARQLGPSGTTELRVEDTYFVAASCPGAIFRHRYDAERQELTMKSRATPASGKRMVGDPEVRREVNLRLAGENQREAVAAFLEPLSITWRGTLTKDICVFYFPDCEVVHYAAWTPLRRVRCVEFEAVGCGDLTQARAVLAAYEERLGFAGKERVKASLFDLLLLPEMTAPDPGVDAAPRP